MVKDAKGTGCRPPHVGDLPIAEAEKRDAVCAAEQAGTNNKAAAKATDSGSGGWVPGLVVVLILLVIAFGVFAFIQTKNNKTSQTADPGGRL